MRFLLPILLLLVGVSVTSANDTAFAGVGGSLRPLQGTHKSIRMVREQIRMTVHHDYYDTQADFVFHNRGPTTTVTMGFPESGGGDIGQFVHRPAGGFHSFATWVDGRRVPARRIAPKGDFDLTLTYRTYWVKRVAFEGNQTRHVRVRYRSPMGEYAHYGINRAVSYSFTGGNWRGRVAESTLTITFPPAGTILAAGFFRPPGGAEQTWSPVQRRGRDLVYRWRDWQAEGHFRCDWGTSLPGWLAYNGVVDGRINATRLTTLSGSRSALGAGVTYPPDAVVRDDRTFVRLAFLHNRLSHQEVHQAGRESGSEVQKEWDGGRSTLRAGRRVLHFEPGRATMWVEGNAVALPAAPFLVRHARRGASLYVPLAPVIRQMGGSLNSEPRKRRFRFDVPAFWNMSPAEESAAAGSARRQS